MNKTKFILILLLALSLFIRVWRIDYPTKYVFDEVYYSFTAGEYAKGNKDAWTYWNPAPEGKAYAWVNPPLPQEIMAGSMLLLQSNTNLAARIPGIFAGVLCIYLVFLIAKHLFKSDKIALFSAFIFSLDGLNFVQSRTAMLDIYLVTFSLLCFTFLIHKKYFFSALFFGMAVASKWTGAYLSLLILFYIIQQRQFKHFIWFIIIPPLVYLATYIPFFLNGFSIQQYIDLLKQEWGYHINLKATHDYASSWWSWPLNLYPIWYFVEYHPNGLMSNIFASGNPVLYWMGIGSILLSMYEYIKTRNEHTMGLSHMVSSCSNNKNLLIIILGFIVFWLPWAFSPRIMFLYYFSPSVPFLSIALGYQLGTLKNRHTNLIVILSLLLLAVVFIALYPFLTGVPLSKESTLLFFDTNFTKNPFR